MHGPGFFSEGYGRRASLAFFLQKWYTKLISCVHKTDENGTVCKIRRREAAGMDCKRAMELMTQFINDQLDAEDVQAFLDHIDSCPECREELEVNYSLMTAMKQLDEDTDLSDNYIEELNKKIETCYLDELKRKRSCVRRRILLGVVVLLLLFMNGITVKEERKEEDRRFFRMITGEETEPDTEWDSEESGSNEDDVQTADGE